MSPELIEKLNKYVEEHTSAHPEYLDKIERQANLHLLNGRMCSGHLQGRLLKMLTNMIRPKRVLELGTFAGFSALCIAEALEEDAHLHTIEIDDELEDFILQNFRNSPYNEKITLHIGSAETVMTEFSPEFFDMIFLDADKRRYVEDFNLAYPLLKPGGYMIADNTLWDGHVVEENKARDPQTAGIKAFNDLIMTYPDLEIVIIPLRDGLTLIRKTK